MSTKSLATALCSLLLLFCNLSAQGDSTVSFKKTYFGLGVGYGFINPEDVNNTIEENTSYDFASGNARIEFAYIIDLNVSHFFSKNVETIGEFEFGWGIKQINSTFGSVTFNSLTRLGFCGNSNYHFNIGDAISIYLGGGLNFNKLFLSALKENIKGDSSPFGLSTQIGFVRKYGKRRMIYEIQYNFITGRNDGTLPEKGYSQPHKISFSGISLKFGGRF